VPLLVGRVMLNHLAAMAISAVEEHAVQPTRASAAVARHAVHQRGNVVATNAAQSFKTCAVVGRHAADSLRAPFQPSAVLTMHAFPISPRAPSSRSPRQ